MQDLEEDPTLGRIGGFRLIRRLATGGTSDVLLARAEGPHGFERTVVLKRLLSEHQDDPEFARMFTREASAYSRLSHPAIVRLFDFFTAQRQLIMVLEYIDGVSLAKLMLVTLGAGRALDDRAALFVACRVFDALAAAHAARDPETGDFAAVIHRDINPSNVLIPWDGHVKLTDFGIAKIVDLDGDTKTGVGGIKGTYGYMAPEQVTGERVTVRTDIYAASIVLWELLARKKAIQSEKLPEMEILRAMAEPNIPSLDALRPDLSPVLREAIARGLAPNPRNRTISAEEMVSVLREHMTSLEDARNALVASLGPLRRTPQSLAPRSLAPRSDADETSSTATAPHASAIAIAQATLMDAPDDDTRAVPSAEMRGLILQSNVPPDAPTKPQLMGAAASALQAVAEPLQRMTPSDLRAVSKPALRVVPQSPRPPPRPAMSSQISQQTLAGGFSPNPDLAGVMERHPVTELSAQHLVADDDLKTDIRPPQHAPTAPITAPMAATPSLSKTVPLNTTLAMDQRPSAVAPSANLAPRGQSEPFMFMPQPAPIAHFEPPTFALQQEPTRRSSSTGIVVAAILFVVVLAGVAGFVAWTMVPPTATLLTASSAKATALPPTTKAPSTAVAVTASAQPSAKPVATVTSVASVAPSSTSKPQPSATASASAVPSSDTPFVSAPAVDSGHGLVHLPPWSAGRRVWIDGKLVGEGPDPKVVVCGAREVRIGSAGEDKLVNVPCGGEVDLAH